jgi:hypothetical protein
MAWGVLFPGRSRASRISGRRLIAAAGNHFEHKSCAVKLHAYTLDSSINLASALQQNMLFPQQSGFILFWRTAMIRAVRQPTNAGFIATHSSAIETDAET